jgi:tyrosine-protein phosphatase SIW14
METTEINATNSNNVEVKTQVKLYAPLSFAQISPGIYRSSYPTPRNYDFLEKLKFKTFICLIPKDINDELRDYCKKKNINLLSFDIKENQEPFLSMDASKVNEAITVMRSKTFFCLPSS